MLEVLAAAVVGIVVGAVLGTVGANRLVDALDSDLIHLVRHDRRRDLPAGGGSGAGRGGDRARCRLATDRRRTDRKFDRLTVLSGRHSGTSTARNSLSSFNPPGTPSAPRRASTPETRMPSSYRESSSSDRDVTVRVVADGGRRRGLVSSVVTLVVVGALAVGVLGIAGVRHRRPRLPEPVQHLDRRPLVARAAEGAQQPVGVLGRTGTLPADDRHRGRRVDPAVVHRRRAHHLPRERDRRRDRRLLRALDRRGEPARRRCGDDHVARTEAGHCR